MKNLEPIDHGVWETLAYEAKEAARDFDAIVPSRPGAPALQDPVVQAAWAKKIAARSHLYDYVGTHH